jgi:UDP-N-acetylglucosamine--N-acetylmuramyl-(pentapeptide) pyrophosphoryl-undecaprenol N-acetylglucosamine transferase
MSTPTSKTPPLKKTICFVAAHSGGHILPALTMAHQLQQDYTILFLTSSTAFDRHLIGNHNLGTVIVLSLEQIPYNRLVRLPLWFIKSVSSFIKSFYTLARYRPHQLISTGGFIALPVCLAAKMLGIPIILYELNIEPGKTIQWLAPLAHQIWITYHQTSRFLPAKKCIYRSYPIRFTEHDIMSKKMACTQLNVPNERTVIMVLGGSQGSIFLNNILKAWLNAHPERHSSLFLIHQTGSYDTTDWQASYHEQGIPALTFSYQEHLAACYQAADLVITRAGAGTLAELVFFKKRSLIIPLETIQTNHQLHNAQALAQAHPSLLTVVRQHELQNNEKLLNELIQELLSFKSK